MRLGSDARRAFVYQEVDLARGAVLRCHGASGVEIRAETSPLCVTVDRRPHAFVAAGHAYRIRGNKVAVFAFGDTHVVIAGEIRNAQAWRIALMPARGSTVVLAEDRPRASSALTSESTEDLRTKLKAQSAV